MKKILLILVCFVLCACSNATNYETQLDELFSKEIVSKNRANNYAEYIEYYVPSDINEESSDGLSFVFDFDDCKMIMNVNVSNIINTKDYKNASLVDDGFFNEDNKTYENKGTYVNINKERNNYFFKIYSYDDENLLYLVSNEVNIYGYCPKNRVILTANKMLQLASGANVNNKQVISDYSTKDVIDYKKNTVNLFANVYPIDGRIEEMMVDNVEEVPHE